MPGRRIALIALLALITQLAACGSTRSYDLADPVALPGLDVEEGDMVTVTMGDGEQHRGRFVAVTADSLTVARSQYRDQIETTVALAEVAAVEVKEGSVLGGVAVGVLAVICALFIYVSSIDWGSLS